MTARLRRLGLVLGGAGIAAIPLGSSDFVAFIFSLGVIYGLVALSLSMLTGWVGQASLGHAAFVGAGAFTAGLLQEHGWPFWALFVAAALVATPVSLIVGVPALRIRGLQLAVATLAFGWTAERAVFGEVFSSYYSGLEVTRPRFGGWSAEADRAYYLVVLAVAVLLTWFAGNLKRRSTGRAFSALRESETVFSHAGGNVASYKLLAFWLSTVYAAVAGVLYGGLLGPLNSELFNLQFSLYILAIAIVGGMHSLIGPYVAGLTFAWYPQLLSGIEALQYWTYLIGGVSIVVFVVALPGGLAAFPDRIAALWRRRPRPVGEAATPDPTAPAADGPLPEAVSSRNGTGPGRAERDRARFQRVELRRAEGRTQPWHAPRPVSPARWRHADRRPRPRPLLRIEGVTMRFGGMLALHDVTFDVNRGSIHGLVGPNGAGKSTLFNCVSGVEQPQTGRIRLGRTELLNLPPHARARCGLARTFQNINLLHGLSVMENLLVAENAHRRNRFLLDGLGIPADRSGKAVKAVAESTLDFLGLTPVRDVPVRDLPHGTMRLVEMGRALTAQPTMLLLDEPAAGLDARESAALATILRRIRDEQHITVLLVEHDMSLVMGVCDNVTVLNAGRVLATGSPAIVRNNPEVVEAYLGAPLEEAADAVVS